MAQRLKGDVRERMLEAAEEVFAASGYSRTTMAEIAGVAGVSTGNLYRYFASKDELFYQLFTDEFAASLLALLKRRVGSLVTTAELTKLDAKARADGEMLLQFWIENRRKVIVLLDGASGSRFDGFAAQFIAALIKPTLASFRERAAGRRLSPIVRQTLEDIFQNTVRTIVSILARHRTEAAIRQAFAAFWSYQLAGLAGFERWATT